MERVPFRRAMGRSSIDGGSGSRKVMSGAKEESIMVSVSTIGVGAGAISGRGRL